MKNLFIVRHGEVQDNSVYYGRLEARLSQKGMETSERAAKQIADERITKVITSPQSRAVYMAGLIGVYCGSPVFTDERIAARDYGEWAGLKKVSVKREDYGFITNKWNLHGNGGESYFDLARRAAPLLDELASSELDGVVIVTHESIMKTMYSLIFTDINGLNKSFDNGFVLEVPELTLGNTFKRLYDKYKMLVK